MINTKFFIMANLFTVTVMTPPAFAQNASPSQEATVYDELTSEQKEVNAKTEMILSAMTDYFTSPLPTGTNDEIEEMLEEEAEQLIQLIIEERTSLDAFVSMYTKDKVNEMSLVSLALKNAFHRLKKSHIVMDGGKTARTVALENAFESLRDSAEMKSNLAITITTFVALNVFFGHLIIAHNGAYSSGIMGKIGPLTRGTLYSTLAIFDGSLRPVIVYGLSGLVLAASVGSNILIEEDLDLDFGN